MMRNDKKVLVLMALMMSVVLPASLSHAGCLITIKAQNSSNGHVVINQKLSKVTLSNVRVWGKVFSKKDAKKNRNIVPAGSNNYSYVFKANQSCKPMRDFKFVIEKGPCQKAFQRRHGGVRQGGRATASIDLGDVGAMCN